MTKILGWQWRLFAGDEDQDDMTCTQLYKTQAAATKEGLDRMKEFGKVVQVVKDHEGGFLHCYANDFQCLVYPVRFA